MNASSAMDLNCIALIASILGGISAQKALERTGIYKPPEPTIDKSAMEARDAEIIRRQAAGEMVKDIASDMGICITTAYNALRRNGIYLKKGKFEV